MAEKVWRSPPGWPTMPPDWHPPEGWRPDPSWPRPPSNWQWWGPPEGSSDRGASSTSGYVTQTVGRSAATVATRLAKPRKMAVLESLLRRDEQVHVVLRLNKMSPLTEFVAVTSHRVLAGTMVPGTTGPLPFSRKLADIDGLETSGHPPRLVARSGQWEITKLGTLLDDDYDMLRDAFTRARSAATIPAPARPPSAPPPPASSSPPPHLPSPTGPAPQRKPRIDLRKPGRAPEPTSPATPAGSIDPAGRAADPAALVQLLRDLGELAAAGVITQEEFSSKKAEILSRL